MTMSDSILRQLEARGLDVELADRMGLASVKGDGGDALIIPFIRDGQVVRRKYRTLQGEKKFWQDKGGVRCAWNEDALRDDNLLDQPVIITEGELDAVAAVQAGFLRTISVPDGAPPPGDRGEQALAASAKYEWLDPIRPLLSQARAPEIILAVDGDPNGAALLQDLSVLLGRARCKFVTYPKKGEGRLKDLNEVLATYGVIGVQETLRRANFLKVDGVFRMSELPPLPDPVVFDIGFNLLSENYRMRLGDFCVVTGIPSFGKSTFVNDLVCRVVRRHGVNAAWASFEQSPQRDHRRNLRTWFMEQTVGRAEASDIARADDWIDARHRFLFPREDEDVSLDWAIDKMEAAVVQHDCKIIVLDPWNEMDHLRRRDETTTEYTGRAIKELKRFTRSFQVHLIVVAHPTKQVKDPATGAYRMPTLYDISDSSHWHNKADVGLIVHRDDPDTSTIKVAKSRYHDDIGKPGAVSMAYCMDDRRYREMERL